MLLGGVRELEVRARTPAASVAWPSRGELPDRVADDRRVADLARAARARADVLLGREERLRPPARRARARAASRAGGRRAAAGRRARRRGRIPSRAHLRGTVSRRGGTRSRSAARTGERHSWPRCMLPCRSRSRPRGSAVPMTESSSRHRPATRPPRACGRSPPVELQRLIVLERRSGSSCSGTSPGSSTTSSARRRATALGYHWLELRRLSCSALGRLTAFLAGYLALIEVLLLARLPFLERLVGFDRLTVWHRWNGHAVHRPRARARRLLGLGLREAGRHELRSASTGTG